MIEINEALALVESHSQPIGTETRATADSVGYVLAEDIEADINSPPHDKALVDGFAIRAADWNQELQLIEQVIAGQVPSKTVEAGTASQIMTGAPIPDGADAMVMVEDCVLESGVVRIGREAKSGQHIMPRATSFARGDVVLSKGTSIRPIEVGLLSEVGRDQVMCFRKPRVAVLPTGEELVYATDRPAPGQIRNSNGPMLAARVNAAGCSVDQINVARDNIDDLRAKIEQGLKSDILILSGGVSAGVRDLVPPTLESLGVKKVFHKVKLKPGKPIWFGIYEGADQRTLVFGLPGNPVSSLVCFELFVHSAIRWLSGSTTHVPKQLVQLGEDLRISGDRPVFYPAATYMEDGQLFAKPIAWKGSSDMLTISQADCLIFLASGERTYAKGEVLSAITI